MTETIIAYTDGACKGNGKDGASAGGFGAHIILPNGEVINIWGGEADTTNNRMELMGAISALEHTPHDVPLQLWTDSGYVKNGISEWIHGWKARGWKKADGKPVLNQALWIRLDEAAAGRQIDWQWVKGHAGHAGNEMADALANRGVTAQGQEHLSADGTPIDQATQATDSTTTAGTADTASASATTTDTAFVRHDKQNPAYDGDTSRLNPDFWAVLPKPINKGSSERQLIMDTETTGFNDQGGDRIVEVGIIELVGRKFTGNQLHVYINPDKQMDDEVIRIHGISNEFLTDKPHFKEVAQAIYDFMAGSEVIAHNAPFDMRFLKMEFDRVGLTDFLDVVEVTDTLAIAKQMYPGQRNSLDALVTRLGVGNKDRTFHGALLDSEILAEVYLKMTGGQIAIDIDEDGSSGDASGAASFRSGNLSQYASLLHQSAADTDADVAWRSAVIK